MKHFIDGPTIAFDTETTGVDVWHGDIPFAFSFCNEAGTTAYFEFVVDPFTRIPVIGKEEKAILRKICFLLEDPAILKIGHNMKFDCRMMERAYDIHICGPSRLSQDGPTLPGRIAEGAAFHDTLIMAHNCNTLELSLGLKQLGDKYCEIDKSDQKTLKAVVQKLRRYCEKNLGWNVSYEYQEHHTGETKKKAQTAADYWIPNTLYRHFVQKGTQPQAVGKLLVDAGVAGLCGEYARKDAIRTMMLYQLYSSIIEEYGTQDIYNLELDLWNVIYNMEGRGVRVSQELLQKQMAQSKIVMDTIYPRLEAATWPGFRPKAPADTRKLFYDEAYLNLPVEKYTKGGKDGAKKVPAVDKFVIKKYVSMPLVRDLAEWQSNYVAYTTFFSKFNKLSIPDPDYLGCTALHADYRQVGGDQGGDRGGVATGRVSSSRPNMQNVMTPENTMAVHPLHVRPAFIPRPGYVWLCTDYAGMEVYMFAAISQEPSMMKAIREGRSIHEEMTDIIWGGEGNEDGIKQMIRALALDGTGMHTSKEVDTQWEEWGITEQDLPKMTYSDKFTLAESFFAKHQFSQVKAQKALSRNNAKTTIKSLTFLKIYGGGAKKASLLLESSYEEAKRVLDRYNDLFPGVQRTFNDLMNEGKANGYITSRWGRRLAIDPNWAYRATNYIVQGSSADCMKRAMVRIDAFLRKQQLDAHVLMTIHDEIVVELRKELLTCWLIRKICKIMCDTEGHLPIDMAVEPKVVTKNWSIKQKVKF